MIDKLIRNTIDFIKGVYYLFVYSFLFARSNRHIRQRILSRETRLFVKNRRDRGGVHSINVK
jgi:hypothetical protein